MQDRVPSLRRGLDRIDRANRRRTEQNFLDTHGEGLHHICYEVEDIQEALTEAQDQGMTDYTEAAVGAGDSRVFFLKPSAVCGVETEFVQLKKNE